MFEKLTCQECGQTMTKVESWAARDRNDRRVTFMCDCGHTVSYSAPQTALAQQAERRSA